MEAISFRGHDEAPAFDPSKPSEDVSADFIPDAQQPPGKPKAGGSHPDAQTFLDWMCSDEVKRLAVFIHENAGSLNEFIGQHQDDPRIEALQTALAVSGVHFRKTCKDLIREKLDDYELHQEGCR